MKKGISLITIIITIIVIVILAGAVILNLSKNNPIESANKAAFLSDLDNFKGELDSYVLDKSIKNLGNYDSTTLSANATSLTYDGVVDTNQNIENIITSLSKKESYLNEIEIKNGSLVYIGTDEKKQQWASSANYFTETNVYTGIFASDIVFSSSTAYLVSLDGTVYAWGENGSGQIGDGTNINKPSATKCIGLGNNVNNIISNGSSTYALLNDRTVMAWGSNSSGQIGDGTTTNALTPKAISGLSNVKSIISNQSTVYALLNDGTVMAWGNNSSGQIGDGTTTNVLIPKLITGLTNVKDIVNNQNTIYALLNDGTVMACGNNQYGQVGDGTTTNVLTPKIVSGLSNVKSIVNSQNTTYALLNDGTVMSWGKNNYGQIGDGTLTNALTPKTISGLSNVKNIVSNGNTTYALLNDKTVKTWGFNNYYLLCDGLGAVTSFGYIK
jgi:alpha-tubulin suppressor-like RCC1 family protein